MRFERFLLELVEQERHNNRIQRWLRASRLPLEKTLDAFDRGRLPLRMDEATRAALTTMTNLAPSSEQSSGWDCGKVRTVHARQLIRLFRRDRPQGPERQLASRST